MSEAPYTQTAHLSGTHSDGITAVAFNPEGSFLATASLDGTVCIWNAGTWSLVDAYHAGKAITSITWVANKALVCGLGDGNMSSLVKDEKHITVSGFWAHRYPVEHLAACGRFVASGAQKELHVYDWNTNAALAHLAKALPPPTHVDDDGDDSESDDEVPTDNGKHDEAELLITGLGWAQGVLVATYLHHGIRLYNTQDWTVVKVIDTKGTIISSSLSPNGGYLAATNLAVGFDIYDLESAKVIRTFKHSVGDHGRPVPVLFVHGGHAILGGSTTGTINIWYVEAAQQLPSMIIPHNQKVLAIAAHYDHMADRFFIATGVMNERTSSSVIIWTSASGGQVAKSDDWEVDSCEDVQSSPGRNVSLIKDTFYVFAGLCVIAAFAFALIATQAELTIAENLDVEYYE